MTAAGIILQTQDAVPDLDLSSRRNALLAQWESICAVLASAIRNVPALFQCALMTESLAAMKPLEDELDALVCAWTAIQYLSGATRPLGDESAAIWVPDSAFAAVG